MKVLHRIGGKEMFNIKFCCGKGYLGEKSGEE